MITTGWLPGWFRLSGPDATPGRRWFRHALWLAPLVFLLYAETLSHEPVWDDDHFIGGWSSVRDVTHLPELFRGATPAGHGGVYRPLRSLLYVCDHALFGRDFACYRAQAVVVHVVCTLLVAAVARRLSGSGAIAALTAVAFGVHPVHVESITFTTSSMDTFGAIFFLAAVLLHLEARDRGWPLSWRALSLGCGVAAFLTDELTLSLPLVLLFIEATVTGIDRRRMSSALPVAGAAAAVLFIRFVLVQVGTRGRYLGGSAILHGLVALKAFALSVALVFVPIGLGVDHTISPGITAYTQTEAAVRAQSPLDPPVLASVGLLALLSAAAVGFVRREPLVTVAIGWIFLTLLPAANLLPQAALVRERYLYLPSFGACLLLATAACRGWTAARGRHRTLARLAIAAAVSGCIVAGGVLTHRLNRAWRDEASLWEAMMEANPQSDLCCFNAAVLREQAGRREEALVAYEAALRANPRNAEALLNAGSIYAGLGRDTLATAAFTSALTMRPDNALAHYNLGVIHGRNGRPERALAAYRRAIECDPRFLAARANFGAILIDARRWSEAARAYEEALVACGGLPSLYARLAEAYAGLGDDERAAAARAKVIPLDEEEETPPRSAPAEIP